MENKFIVRGHTSFIGKTGYNNHSRDFFTALSKLVNVKIRNFTVGGSWTGLNDDPHAGEDYISDYQKMLMCEQTTLKSNNEGLNDSPIYDGFNFNMNDNIHIILNETNHHYFYQHYKYGNDFKIAYNVWESTRQPKEFFETMLKYDQLWVPTTWQKEVSIEQGFDRDKVFVVPEAVDGDIFNPDKSKIPSDYDDGRFKFTIFGRWDYRKSTTEIIKTFLDTFNKDEPVDLIISVDNPYSVDGMKTTEERLERYGFVDDRVKILKFLETREDYVNYLKAGHVFLSCARSEGWNLPLIESMACGVPTIYSDWGAQLEFAEGVGHPVNVIGERPVSDGDSQSYGLGKESAFGENEHGINSEVSVPGNYCEPDFDDLSKVMRDVYTNYWEYKKKALKDSEYIRNKFTWENAAKKAYTILDNAYSERNKTKLTKPKLELKEELNDEVAFFTGGDSNYLPTVESCVKSLLEFSNIPIIVYGFNCDVNFDYPNMIKRRVDINRPKPNGRDTRMYYAKIDASLDCLDNDPNKTYMWIDGDCVVTKNIDTILKNKEKLLNYPLCMSYIHDNLFHWRYFDDIKITKGHGQELGDYLGYKRNNNFTIATGLFMFDNKSRWFFDEVIENHEKLLKVNIPKMVDDMALAEERLFNVLFWKYGFNSRLPVTWISKDYDNNDLVPKFKKISVDKQFDIMFDNSKYNKPNSENVLFFHGQRNTYLLDEMVKTYKKGLISDKLMIVAHPDDESIFGSNLLLNEDGWKVVCVTNGDGDGNDSEIRLKEFKEVMEFTGSEYEILSYPDDMKEILFNENDLLKDLRKIINEKKYIKIVTHNEDGEYGHILHKTVNRVVTKINPDNLYTFSVSENKLDEATFKYKKELLEMYKSQNTNLPGFRQYLIYEGIKKWN